MKNTHFTHPEFGPHQLGTSSITLTGYAPLRHWVLMPLHQGEGFTSPDWCKPPRTLHYAGSRKEVADCLLAAGWALMG